MKKGSPDKLLAEWFWIERWDGSPAAGLPLLARGLYREMLTRAWRLGGWLPNDHEAIQRLVRVTAKEWAAAWPKVMGYWREAAGDPTKLVNDTQLEVMEEARRRREEASEHGRKGARARFGQCPSNARALPGDKPPSPSPLTDSKKEQESSQQASKPSHVAAAEKHGLPVCDRCSSVAAVQGFSDGNLVCLTKRGGCGNRWRERPPEPEDPPGFKFGLRTYTIPPDDEPTIPPHLRPKPGSLPS